MDKRDEQDKRDGVLPHAKISETIIGCAFDVSNELGVGFLESVYENALSIALRERGMQVRSQVPIDVYFHGKLVGKFFADLLVEEKVIVELKAVSNLGPQHEAQVINYLSATDISVGLLINFGNPKVQYRRLTRRKNFPVP